MRKIKKKFLQKTAKLIREELRKAGAGNDFSVKTKKKRFCIKVKSGHGGVILESFPVEFLYKKWEKQDIPMKKAIAPYAVAIALACKESQKPPAVYAIPRTMKRWSAGNLCNFVLPDSYDVIFFDIHGNRVLDDSTLATKKETPSEDSAKKDCCSCCYEGVRSGGFPVRFELSNIEDGEENSLSVSPDKPKDIPSASLTSPDSDENEEPSVLSARYEWRDSTKERVEQTESSGLCSKKEAVAQAEAMSIGKEAVAQAEAMSVGTESKAAIEHYEEAAGISRTVKCPHCGEDVARDGRGKKGEQRYRCKVCGKYCSEKTAIYTTNS